MTRYISNSLEIASIVLLCYLFAGSPPPAVNEPHYLGKAKHYWDPSWCAGDFFLESGDAHEVFYWTFGWVTHFVSLDTSAWIGRLLVWFCFALAWRTLAHSCVHVRFSGLISAIVLLPLTYFFHMSGEWLIGGIEAKGFAWPLVFLGIAKACQGRWWLVWPLFGLASSFHILVGGWAVIAGLVAWFLRRQDDELDWRALALWLVLGGTLALPGLVPALQLTAQATAEETREASVTYTFRRLSHHLVFYRFSLQHITRFAALVAIWWYLYHQRATGDRLRRAQCFVIGSLTIAALGIAIDLLSGPISQDARASLMRYYWFRMSDILVPAGTALFFVAALELPPTKRLRTSLCGMLALAVWGITIVMSSQGVGGRSTAVQQQTWHNLDDDVEASQIDLAWTDVCQWIQDAENVPTQSVFLTPTHQQTFKWYAERPDVVTWKDVPQDARSLNAWWQRREEVYQLGDWPWNEPEKFANIVEAYSVTHVVWPDPHDRPVFGNTRQIYRNELFRVFRID